MAAAKSGATLASHRKSANVGREGAESWGVSGELGVLLSALVPCIYAWHELAEGTLERDRALMASFILQYSFRGNRKAFDMLLIIAAENLGPELVADWLVALKALQESGGKHAGETSLVAVDLRSGQPLPVTARGKA